MRPGASYPTLKLEDSLWADGLSRLAGVDEVGRGALAGCVVAAAVVLPPDVDRAVLTGIRDSKQLTRTRREALVHVIRAAASAIGIGAASPAAIDRLNIRRATALAIQRALNQLDIEHVLVDGLPVTELEGPQTAIVGGDRLCLSIAAASIVAKVTRDRWMCSLDARYPGYGWSHNAGYGTDFHLSALRELGPTSQHRVSFAPVRISKR